MERIPSNIKAKEYTKKYTPLLLICPFFGRILGAGKLAKLKAMAAVSSQLRQLAISLTDADSFQVIIDVKSKMLSLADDLEKGEPLLRLSDIDDILDEIDKKESEIKNIANDEIAERIRNFLLEFTNSPLISNLFNKRLNEKTWPLLFHTASETQIDEWKSKHQKFEQSFPWSYKNLDLPAPLEKYCNDIADEQLLKIYDEIPESITNAHDQDYILDEKFLDLAKWMLEYRQDTKNKESKHIMDKIYEGIMHYVYTMKFQDIVRDGSKTVNDADEFYRKYHQYVDINHGLLSNGVTVKYIFLYNNILCILIDFVFVVF